MQSGIRNLIFLENTRQTPTEREVVCIESVEPSFTNFKLFHEWYVAMSCTTNNFDAYAI